MAFLDNHEPILGDHNAHLHIGDPVVAGQRKGRGAVPRDYAVQPRPMFDPPSSIPVIPRSEWPDRLRDAAAKGMLLSVLRGAIPSLDQGQVGYCVTEDTEVLTEKGWVAYPDYNWTDLLATVNPLTHRMEFQAPFERHVHDYDGPMLYSTNRRINFGVTPDHEMYVRKWDERRRSLSPHYSFVRAQDLGWYSGLLASPSGWRGTELVEVEVPGDRRYDGDDFLALLGLIVSDGYAGGTDNTRNWVSFASFREETRPAIAALAARIGFRECPGRPGVWIRYGAGALAEWMRANCYTGRGLKAANKRAPDVVKVASVRQIKHFLNFFDDRNRDGDHFYSTSKRLIDDLQELFLRVGKRSTITNVSAKETVYDGKTIRSAPAFALIVGKTDRLCLERKHHIETERYKGRVYCAAVPNHTLITRRNGSVLISSNCWAHSTTHAVMLARAVANLPYVPLSAFSIAATIKQGADEGGWGGLSAQFAREKGIMAQSVWPQGDTNYRHYDTPANWENAALHRSQQEWVDLARDVYDQDLTFDQCAACSLLCVPGPVDFNWWSHSVCRLDLVDGAAQRGTSRGDSGKLLALAEFDQAWGMNHPVTAGFGLRIWNSWSDQWGTRGTGVLTGSRAIPDGALAIRVTTPSLS